MKEKLNIVLWNSYKLPLECSWCKINILQKTTFAFQRELIKLSNAIILLFFFLEIALKT